MGSGGSPWETLGELLLTPLLVVLFACCVLGSFVIWRIRTVRASGEHVPFDLHLFHREDRNVKAAAIACCIGLVALVLPVSLILQRAG